jgi:hypothetical protein
LKKEQVRRLRIESFGTLGKIFFPVLGIVNFLSAWCSNSLNLKAFDWQKGLGEVKLLFSFGGRNFAIMAHLDRLSHSFDLDLSDHRAGNMDGRHAWGLASRGGRESPGASLYCRPDPR